MHVPSMRTLYGVPKLMYAQSAFSDVAWVASFGGQKWCDQGKKGKGCSQDERSQKGCRAWRIIMELTGGRVL